MDQPECCALADLPGRLKARYRRLALITSRRHLERLDGQDEDTLVVCCDWLLWQQELAAGRHIAYYELGLRDWDEPDPLATDLFLRANDWIPDDDNGGDPTVFRNVSLGRLFCAEMSMAMMNYHRLERALRKLIERFRPSEIWFFDFIYDINLLSPPLRKHLVETVARDCGIAVADRSSEAPLNDHHIAEAVFQRKGHGPLATAILVAYAELLDMATRIRCALSFKDRRVLILVNSNMAEPLVRNFVGGLTPTFIGRTVPRKVGLLWRCLRHGIRLATVKTPSLSDTDHRRLRAIRETLQGALSAPADGAKAFARAYVRREILDAGRFEDMASEVCAAERLLDGVRPERIVVDGVRQGIPRICIELARTRGIAVDYIWHSPLTPLRLKMDALGGDAHYSPRVTRCLSWGRTNEKWLDCVEAPPERVRVGSPLRDHYAGPQRQAVGASASDAKNVLLLQYTFQTTDLAGLNANMYENFVETVRELHRLGYADIRFKLHPGPGRWTKSYFQNIADTFGLGCRVLKTAPFHECLAWADVVIGPALTGAMYETLAAGKPYHAFLLAPHSVDIGYFAGFPLISGLDQLEQSLCRNSEPEGRKLLDDLYSIDEIPNPPARLWAVLGSDADDNRERRP